MSDSRSDPFFSPPSPQVLARGRNLLIVHEVENIYLSDKDPNSNFVGDWDATCEYCGRPHKEHIWKEHPDPTYKHRMPCEPQKLSMRKAWNRKVGAAKTLYLVGWVLVPLGIAIVGFASWWVGLALFVISLCKIGWRLVESYGSPEKWIPSYKKKQAKELKMRHYYYHCERNPDAFTRLRAENFAKEYPDES